MEKIGAEWQNEDHKEDENPQNGLGNVLDVFGGVLGDEFVKEVDHLSVGDGGGEVEDEVFEREEV